MFWRHDPRPLIVSSRYNPKYGAQIGENLVAGFNLHYLHFGLVRGIVKAFTQNPQLATRVGLKHSAIKLSYRTYKVKGVQAPRRIDWRGFLSKIAIIRQLKPYEREALIASVEAQLTQNPRDLTSINRMVAEKLQSMQTVTPSTGIGGGQNF